MFVYRPSLNISVPASSAQARKKIRNGQEIPIEKNQKIGIGSIQYYFIAPSLGCLRASHCPLRAIQIKKTRHYDLRILMREDWQFL